MSSLNQHLNPPPFKTIRRLWNAGMTLEEILKDHRIKRTALTEGQVTEHYTAIEKAVGVRSLTFSELENGIGAAAIQPVEFKHMRTAT